VDIREPLIPLRIVSFANHSNFSRLYPHRYMEIIDNAWETTTKIKPNFIVSFKTYSLVTGALIILNIVLYNYATNTSGYLDSEINLTSSLSTILIAFPVVSSILAVLFALIPYKESL
jgi:hypothetical protein